jgi:hypothetical protein
MHFSRVITAANCADLGSNESDSHHETVTGQARPRPMMRIYSLNR